MNRDLLLQQKFPTIMVPKYGQLIPCELHMTRLLMARKGLYLQTKQPFGEFICQIWKPPRPLPYGDVEEVDEIRNILWDQSVQNIFREHIGPAAQRYAEDNKEWAGWILYEDREFVYAPLQFEAHHASVTITDKPAIPLDTCLAIDVHSHGQLPPFFSGTDNIDDAGGVKISVVLGGYSNGKFKTKSRVAVEGFFFPIEGTP